jgi:hypothetical protein
LRVTNFPEAFGGKPRISSYFEWDIGTLSADKGALDFSC